MRPQFNRDQIADLDLFEKHLQNLFNILDRQADSQGWTQSADIQHFVELFTIDTATEFLFGESVNSLEGKTEPNSLATKEEMKIFVDSFVSAEKVTAESLLYADLYWVIHDRKFKDQCAAVHKFVDTYVQRRLKSPSSERKGKFVVLDALVDDTKDPFELRYELLNILLAGSDTIKASITFLLGSLAQNPAVFEKLRAIILKDFGTYSQPINITISGLKACTYLQWCLNETLRMYAPVPINYREAVRDTTLPFGGGLDGQSPVFIPKGRFVNWSVRHPFCIFLCLNINSLCSSALDYAQ
jgi:cytochrome P450